MKKYSILVLVLVLTAAMFTGCGCRNNQASPTTSAPTTPSTVPTTAATTEATTEATTMPSVPSNDATIEDGNGPMPTNATAGADGDTSNGETGTEGNGNARNGASGMEGRARRMPKE